ncbi:MAG: DUF3352 domain-containing protein [Candidatus Omnitrophota bacterium]
MQNVKIKIIILFSVITVTIISVVFYPQLSKPPKIGNLTDLLLQDALICLCVRDIDSAWNKIKSTEIYSQLINSAAFKDSLTINALKDKTKERWFEKQELLRILGKETLMGVFFRSATTLEDAEFDVVVLSRISGSQRVRESIYRSISMVKKDKLTTVLKYKGYKITTIKQSEAMDGLTYLILGDVLIASNSLDAVKEAIDLYKSGFKNSISYNNGFKRAKDRLSDDFSAWLYLDIKGFSQLANNLKESNTVKFMVTPLDAYFLELKFNQGIAIKGWSYLGQERKEDPSLTAALASLNNAKLTALGFTPFSAAMFSGGNLGDIKLFWEYTKNQLEKSIGGTDPEGVNRFTQFYTRANTLLGFDIEKDVLPYLGNEYACSLAGFKELNVALSYQGRPEALSLSLPEFFGCIKVLDKEKINNIMQGLWQRMNDGLNKYFASLQAEQAKEAGEDAALREENAPLPAYLETNNYSAVDIYALKLKSSLTLPFGLNADIFSPSYCFLGDYLVATTNDSLLKMLINTYQKKNLNLSDSVKFSQVRHNLQPEFNNFFYANPKEVIEPLSRMFGSLPIKVGNDTKQEEYKRNLIKTLQLLDILKDIKGIGSSWLYKDNFYEFYIFVPVEGL